MANKSRTREVAALEQAASALVRIADTLDHLVSLVVNPSIVDRTVDWDDLLAFGGDAVEYRQVKHLWERLMGVALNEYLASKHLPPLVASQEAGTLSVNALKAAVESGEVVPGCIRLFGVGSSALLNDWVATL